MAVLRLILCLLLEKNKDTMKKISVTEIVKCLGKQLLKVSGNYEGVYVDNLADVAHVNANTLDWVNPAKENKQKMAEHSKARVIIVDDSVTEITGKVLIHVQNPKKALAMIGNVFFVQRPNPGIHPTAIVDEEAVIGKDVYIGPYAVVGKAEIGDDPWSRLLY